MAYNVAANLRPVRPVQAFLEGRDRTLRNSLAERQVAGQEQAQEFNQQNALFNQRRLTERDQAEQAAAQQKAEQERVRAELQRGYTEVQRILAAPAGQKRAVAMALFDDDDRAEFASEGIDIDSLDDDGLQEIASRLENQIGSQLGIAPPKQDAYTLSPGQSRFVGDKEVASVPATEGSPSSYDEFTLAQKDPAFAAFLKGRRGKGISMTMPDGTVVEIGGEGGGIGPQDLSGPTKNRLQESIIQSTDELDRLNSIGAGFDPQFLQIPGRLRGAGLKVKDLAGGVLGELKPEERDYLAKFSTFKADAAKNLSTILNRLSGAAISPAEGERLKKGIPNDNDSPTQFTAKYHAAVKDATRAIMRANWALKNGIGVQSVDQLSRSMPLEAIDQVFEQRANQLWQQLGGDEQTRQQAIDQAKREFGLVR